MADPTAAPSLPGCGASVVNTPPVLANAFPGTVWGPDPNFLAITTEVASRSFPKMTQFLAANPNRVGLYLRSQFAGLRVACIGNGQGVPLTQTFGNAPNAGGNFEITIWGPPIYLVSPWFWAVADVAGAPGALDQLLTWIEFIKVD